MSEKTRIRLLLLSVVLSLSIFSAISSSNTQPTQLTPHLESEILTQLFESTKDESSLLRRKIVKENDMDTASVVHPVFRENCGQQPGYIDYYAMLPQGIVGFGCSAVFFVLEGSVIKLSFLDANLIKAQGAGQLKGYSNH
ncbi:MAG: hypothetical protein JSV04_06090, partial [Candidatus Heimdallarchaeota archaeon]